MTNNAAIIIRPALPIDAEFVMARNWWLTDPHLADDALRVYLFFRSLPPWQKMTQTEARAAHNLDIKSDGKWARIKAQLRAGGYLVEVQDRYPAGSKNVKGQDISGSRRFRFIIQEPTELSEISDAESLIKSDKPINIDDLQVLLDSEKSLISTTPENRDKSENHYSRKSGVVTPETEKSLISTTPENRDQCEITTPENRESYKELKLGKELINNSSRPLDVARAKENQPAVPAEVSVSTGSVSGRADGSLSDELVNKKLQALHPSLSVAALERAVNGRVDLTRFDLVLVCQDILSGAKGLIRRPVDYVAKSLVNNPHRYFELGKSEPFSAGSFEKMQKETLNAVCEHVFTDDFCFKCNQSLEDINPAAYQAKQAEARTRAKAFAERAKAAGMSPMAYALAGGE